MHIYAGNVLLVVSVLRGYFTIHLYLSISLVVFQFTKNSEAQINTYAKHFSIQVHAVPLAGAGGNFGWAQRKAFAPKQAHTIYIYNNNQNGNRNLIFTFLR